MKSVKVILLSIMFISNVILYAMGQQGPMNAEWFYADTNPFKSANDVHQKRLWKDAALLYRQFLHDNVGSEYDKEMAKLNLAACLMAQREATNYWSSFDVLLGIEEKQRLSVEKINSTNNKGDKKSVLVRTDQVGIGDIVHFLETVHQLKKGTNWDITVSVRPFLQSTLSNVVKDYGCALMSEKDKQPETDYITHIMGLYGHFEMDPTATKPEKVLLMAPERANGVVAQEVNAILAQGKVLGVVFLGEDRSATLIGGKQLPRDKKNHGRQMTSESFQELLKNNKNLVLMDCGTKDSRITVGKDQQQQYMVLPKEEQPFDAVIALARIMSLNKKIVGFGADQGPTNVFTRALDPEAQKRMSFIIQNPEEYDMRMEGDGSEYTQMISDCNVFKSDSLSPEDQAAVLQKALNKMMAEK
ncbi:MAG TPA: hypothetical protein VLB80_02445 [Candidatus Babeliales bacterium]|nr:hypothetical protein [Candidatus Babeliales bacterium]